MHKVLAIGTIKSFLRQAQLTTDEFLSVLE